MRFLIVLLCFFGVALAGNTVGDNATATPDLPLMQPGSSMSEAQTPLDPNIQRQAILEFEFDPETDVLIARVSDASGTKPLKTASLEVDAISDSGKKIVADVQRLSANSFKSTLNVDEGQWNLITRVKIGTKNLDGQYTLGVGKSVTEGRFALTPPNPEVGRLSWIIGLAIGVPLGLGLIIGLLAVMSKALRPKAQKSTSA